ncbi:MAG: altronate dehydratase family protein [Bacillota bacterium]|nr:altronate dehydratase family protein [Bacillota bacterium]
MRQKAEPEHESLKNALTEMPADQLALPHLLIHPADHVVVLLEDSADGIPAGHKIARQKIKCGETIFKYGSPIGHAIRDIAPGEWVHSHNLATSLSANWQPEPITEQQEQDAQVIPAKSDAMPADDEPDVFFGYRRADGQVGIRNEIWILPTVGCVNVTAEKLTAFGQAQIDAGYWPGIDGVQALTHPFGCSQLGDDHEQTVRLLASLVHHPNAAAVLVVSLGCENNQVESFQKAIGTYDDERVAFMIVQEVAEELAHGQMLMAKLAEQAGRDRRTACPLADLVIGLKCGGSDALSGITANPLLGLLTDRVIANGGSALLTEIPEFFGAEQVLLERTPDRAARQAFIQLIDDFRHYYEAHGVPVYENPSPGNKAGGITTLEEKSLGCIQKAGTQPVTAIVRYGCRRHERGLSIVEGPGNDLVAITALAAAGAQLILFTTGRGNPLGSPVPTLKIASNSELANKKPHWIDFDAGPALSGQAAFQVLCRELLNLVCRTASGQYQARNETSGYRSIAIFKNGVTL